MTKLSPKVQFVLDAFLAEWDVYAVDDARNGIAAAIRMSVAKCECIDDYGNSYINSQDLLTIANELEGVPLSEVAQYP